MKDTEQPLVSIITPCYNAEKFIAHTIESVRNQTYSNWEMLIIDDCSTDQSKQIINRFSATEHRIILIELKENKGTAYAKNQGIAAAKGNFIAFIDADDVWLPQKLEKQLEELKKTNAAICFTSYQLIDENSRLIQKVISAPKKVNLKKYLKTTIIGFSTSIINREITGDFSIMNLRSREDTQLWIHLLKQGHLAVGINEVLTLYRIHPNSLSANKLKSAALVWDLYFRIEKLGFFRSVYFFGSYAINALGKHIFNAKKTIPLKD